MRHVFFRFISFLSSLVRSVFLFLAICFWLFLRSFFLFLAYNESPVLNITKIVLWGEKIVIKFCTFSHRIVFFCIFFCVFFLLRLLEAAPTLEAKGYAKLLWLHKKNPYHQKQLRRKTRGAALVIIKKKANYECKF